MLITLLAGIVYVALAKPTTVDTLLENQPSSQPRELLYGTARRDVHYKFDAFKVTADRKTRCITPNSIRVRIHLINCAFFSIKTLNIAA